jgi:fatty-acyl-CoA synthase
MTQWEEDGQYSLLVKHVLQRARELFGDTEVVSCRPDGSRVRSTYAETYRRVARLAHALGELGVRAGDRVATLCWNHRQHLEAYLAVPASGAVVHTLNLRLHPSELAYIVRHAGDKVIIVDRSLLPLLEQFRHEVPSLEHEIVVGDGGSVPDGMLDYETLLANERSEEYAWPELDERAPAMLCYTSGTTGKPKGVVYSHRSMMLHTLASAMRDTLGVHEADCVLPAVPMFHAAAWGLPYTAVLTGAKLVLPGPKLDAASLIELIASESVSLAAGVPTVWLGVLALLDEQPKRFDLSRVRSILVGGAAAPTALVEGFEDRHGLTVTHAWGMTETNPMGTVAHLRRGMKDLPREEQLSARVSQGYGVPFLEMRHVGPSGDVLPRDGKSPGELWVRGAWVARSYLGNEEPERFAPGGWLKTGDIVTIDARGFMRITDRAKDLVKSGGEWISSISLENALMSHRSILEAAVFAVPHRTWGERPVAAIVKKPGMDVQGEELLALLAQHFPKFWLPDRFVWLERIPRTSTGKFLKSQLRADYSELLVG